MSTNATATVYKEEDFGGAPIVTIYKHWDGCLTAQLIAHLKDGPGDVYLVPVSEADGHEFTYRIRLKDAKAVVTCDQEPGW